MPFGGSHGRCKDGNLKRGTNSGAQVFSLPDQLRRANCLLLKKAFGKLNDGKTAGPSPSLGRIILAVHTRQKSAPLTALHSLPTPLRFRLCPLGPAQPALSPNGARPSA